MKIFITGVSGLLGVNLAFQLRHNFQIAGAYFSHPVTISDCETMKLDLTSEQDVFQAIESTRPDVVINTVALTDVEKCESDPDLADFLNHVSACNAARASSNIGAKFVHISTDHLFDGTKPWMTETDEPSPLNIYAKTKYQGELSVLEVCPAALIIRTNFFGWGTTLRASFSDWILNSLAVDRPMNMFVDSYFTPILINDLIDSTTRLIESGASGTFNAGGAERISKYEFGIRLAKTFEYSTENINPVSMDSFHSNAIRPKDMSLDSNKMKAFLNAELRTLDQSLTNLRELRSQGWPQILESGLAKSTSPRLKP